ncbi:MAG: hypothetical protein QOH93_1285 [Chloroflexia bacterium]|nr:hypothetical protein [Chloroflexia bacterium]
MWKPWGRFMVCSWARAPFRVVSLVSTVTGASCRGPSGAACSVGEGSTVGLGACVGSCVGGVVGSTCWVTWVAAGVAVPAAVMLGVGVGFAVSSPHALKRIRPDRARLDSTIDFTLVCSPVCCKGKGHLLLCKFCSGRTTGDGNAKDAKNSAKRMMVYVLLTTNH